MKKTSAIIILAILISEAAYCPCYCQNVTTVEIPEGKTLYDLQSNSSSHMIMQRASNPAEIHAVFMVSTNGGPSWDSRNTRYFYSTNSGSSWMYLGTVFTTRSGFPCITITNDGRAVVLGHSTENGGIQRTYFAVDLAPGVGSWSILDPGSNGNFALAPIWPVVSIDPANNKIIFAGSQNGVDSAFINVCTNINSPGTFTGYKALPQSETAGQYATAAGTGVYGAAYCTLNGGAVYLTSTNGGTTWGSPVTIWTWNPSDRMGAFRGIDITYNGSTPQVVFGLADIDPVGGTWNPSMPAKIMFWSPAVNGGNPVKIDSAGGLTGPNPQNDVHVSVCRPVIGSSASGNILYCVYTKARIDIGSNDNNYFDIYISCSENGGANWSAPFRVSNRTGPLKDCRYPSVSNRNAMFSGTQAINILYQGDSIPGSSIGGAEESWAKMMYARVTNMQCNTLGIAASGENPGRFTLEQNYPNPFNPVTLIKFFIPERSFVNLTIYNILGEQVRVLINGTLDAGGYNAEWNASSYPSGIYFYRLTTGEQSDVKKMILLK